MISSTQIAVPQPPPEPLSGTFDLVSAPRPPVGNLYLYYQISNITFQSEHYGVTGTSGVFSVATIPGPITVSMSASVTINGQAVPLEGTISSPIISQGGDMITGLHISGNGFTITINASSEGGHL
jgi:hypothetical protein